MHTGKMVLAVTMAVWGFAGVIPCIAATWDYKAGSGSWTDSKPWGLTYPYYPGDAYSRGTTATIDGEGDHTNTVSLTRGVVINGLGISTNDTLALDVDTTHGYQGIIEPDMSSQISDFNSLQIWNNGSIVLNPQTSIHFNYVSKGTLKGSGTVTLASDKSYLSGWFTIGSDQTIVGRGYIQQEGPNAGIENNGHILASFGTLSIFGPLLNGGILGTADTWGVLRLAYGEITGGNFVPNEGFLMAGGRIEPGSGTANLKNATVSYMAIGQGTVSVTGGALADGVSLSPQTEVRIANGCGLSLVRTAVNPVNPTITNDGVIKLESGPISTSLNTGTQPNILSTLTGSGQVILGGLSSRLNGNFINDYLHTIRGGGTIDGTMINRGNIIADNGTLVYQASTLDNYKGAISVTQGSILEVYSPIYGGNINPQQGLVRLKNSTLLDTTWGAGAVEVAAGATAVLWGTQSFNAGTTLSLKGGLTVSGATLVNDGLINLNAFDLKVQASSIAMLTGAGKAVLGSGSLNGGKFVNDVNHTIEGGSASDSGGIKALLENRGRLVANTGKLNVYSPIAGTGNVYLENNATLRLRGDVSVQAGNWVMAKDSRFYQDGFGKVELSGNFTFAQTSATLWFSLADGVIRDLQMDGGPVHPNAPWQSLEVGGKDYGENDLGFNGNFHLDNLTVTGDKTFVYLVDAFDNGSRGPGNGSEVLYVKHLTVSPGATLDLNGIKLYVNIPGNSPHLLNTWKGDRSWLGGGAVIDEPVQKYLQMNNILIRCEVNPSLDGGKVISVDVSASLSNQYALEAADDINPLDISGNWSVVKVAKKGTTNGWEGFTYSEQIDPTKPQRFFRATPVTDTDR